MGRKKIDKSIPDALGAESISWNGEKMKVIRCKPDRLVDVQFEDGSIVEDKFIFEFKAGYVYKYDNVFESVENPNETVRGVKLIRFGSLTDVDVRFEDGTIVEHQWYLDFCRGNIINPQYEEPDKWKRRQQKLNQRKGIYAEKVEATCGLTMRIDYVCEDKSLKVEFEDGMWSYCDSYEKFKEGQVKYDGLNEGKKKRKMAG